MTFSKMTLSVIYLFAILRINDIQHNETRHTSIEGHYVDCCDYLNVLLSALC
jgi:hypothetical protein